MPDDAPTVGSLFSGIGGIDLGLERAGFRVLWQCESNPYARRVLAKHWPGIPCYPDVRTLGCDVPRVDLLCGGFPCQPVSHAGNQKFTKHNDWLWPAFADAIGLLRPRLVLVENVTGLLARSGPMGSVLGDLAALGYDAEWSCISAGEVGAPHLRPRIWLVGYTDRDREPVVRFDAEASRLSSARQNWPAPPRNLRMVDGVSARMERLGNAVVPQIAQYIGEMIYARFFSDRPRA